MGGQRKVYTQGGTGDFNQALATRGRTGEPGQWPQRRNGTWKGEGPSLGECRGPLEKPDSGLRISVHLVPALAPCLPQPRAKNGLAGPPFLLGWVGVTLILPPVAPVEYPAPTEAPLLSPGDLVPNLLRASLDSNASLNPLVLAAQPRAGCLGRALYVENEGPAW